MCCVCLPCSDLAASDSDGAAKDPLAARAPKPAQATLDGFLKRTGQAAKPAAKESAKPKAAAATAKAKPAAKAAAGKRRAAAQSDSGVHLTGQVSAAALYSCVVLHADPG